MVFYDRLGAHLRYQKYVAQVFDEFGLFLQELNVEVTIVVLPHPKPMPP